MDFNAARGDLDAVPKGVLGALHCRRNKAVPSGELDRPL